MSERCAFLVVGEGVVRKSVKVVKAKSASLQGMRARDARTRETLHMLSTAQPSSASKLSYLNNKLPPILQTEDVMIRLTQSFFVTFPRFFHSLGAYLPIYL